MKMQKAHIFILISLAGLTSNSQVFLSNQRLLGYDHNPVNSYENPPYSSDTAIFYYSGNASTFIDPHLEIARFIEAKSPDNLILSIPIEVIPPLPGRNENVLPVKHSYYEFRDNIKFDSVVLYNNDLEITWKIVKTYQDLYITSSKEYIVDDGNFALYHEEQFFYDEDQLLDEYISIDYSETLPDTNIHLYYTFDDDLIKEVVDTNGKWIFDFNQYEQLSSFGYMDNDSTDFQIITEYTYQDDQPISAIKYSIYETEPVVYEFIYDEDLLLAIHWTDGKYFDLAYTPDGKLIAFDWNVQGGNGHHEYNYDENGKLTFYTETNSYNTKIIVDIDYNAQNQISSVANYYYYGFDEDIDDITMENYFYNSSGNIVAKDNIYFSDWELSLGSINDQTNEYPDPTILSSGTYYYEDYKYAGSETETISINAFPNPADNTLYIQIGNINGDRQLYVHLSNLIGQNIFEADYVITKPYLLTIDCRYFMRGFYIISVSDGINVSWQKIFIN